MNPAAGTAESLLKQAACGRSARVGGCRRRARWEALRLAGRSHGEMSSRSARRRSGGREIAGSFVSGVVVEQIRVTCVPVNDLIARWIIGRYRDPGRRRRTSLHARIPALFNQSGDDILPGGGGDVEHGENISGTPTRHFPR
jgi:hypothetical protein